MWMPRKSDIWRVSNWQKFSEKYFITGGGFAFRFFKEGLSRLSKFSNMSAAFNRRLSITNGFSLVYVMSCVVLNSCILTGINFHHWTHCGMEYLALWLVCWVSSRLLAMGWSYTFSVSQSLLEHRPIFLW